jgi:hypothetical protein
MDGYNAGVEKTPSGQNLYVQPPQRIDLSTSYQGFLSELPDVPAYHDASMRAQMMRLRRLMLARYEGQIESFVETLRAQPSLHLAQTQQQSSQGAQQQSQAAAAGTTTPAQTVPPAGLTPSQAAGVASTVVSGWRAANQGAGAQAAVAAILLAMALRGSAREVKLANLSQDVVDRPALSQWATQRASFVIDSVDSTINEEFETFLRDELQTDKTPAQVAEDAVERFGDTHETHTDRVVLSESLPAYNRGALQGYLDNGVSEVQARDASEGTDLTTDAECLRRHGRVYPVQDAINITDHPYGTLYWIPLSSDRLQFERVPKLPAALNGRPDQIVAYDSDREVLYMQEGMTEQQETELRLSMGELLRLR